MRLSPSPFSSAWASSSSSSSSFHDSTFLNNNAFGDYLFVISVPVFVDVNAVPPSLVLKTNVN